MNYHLLLCCSVAQSYPTLCNPMDCSTPSSSVLPHLQEFAQTHVYRVGDVIQPSHPLSSPSPPALNLFQHQGLFQWVSSSHQVAKVLEFQHRSVLPMNIQDLFPLRWTGWISLRPRDSQVTSPTPQFKSINSLALSPLYSPTLTSIHDYMTIALTRPTFVGKVMSLLFSMLSRLVITFLPRNKCFFIS